MPDEVLPSFSVVVPTYGRHAQLGRLLEALAWLDYPRDRYEGIVVDDGGSAPVGPILEAFHDRMKVTLLRQDNTGPAGARNHGAARAAGRYLAFTDDDCWAGGGLAGGARCRIPRVPRGHLRRPNGECAARQSVLHGHPTAHRLPL